MSTRPFEKLPTIRAKLGSTIVFAVGMTVILVYFILAFALRNSFRDADLVELLQLAQSQSRSEVFVDDGRTSFLAVEDGAASWLGERLPDPPRFDGGVHVGVANGVEYAAVPSRSGDANSMFYAVRREPGFLVASSRFLFEFWPQLLVAGALASGIALVVARWLARGMTQPLRDMAQAASQMETGDYRQRVHTKSRDEVGQLAAAFNRMSAELENLERSRRDLVANVSHELKTPIAAIRAHLENVLDGVEQPDPRTLQIMLTQTERLSRLVDQLLELSRLESGELPLRREEITLGPLVTQVLSEIEVARSDRGVAVTNGIPDDLPPVEGDRERVHQVLFNLLDNALRFTPSGGVVTVSAERQNGSVKVRVSDTGVGISPEHLPRLFERFYRRIRHDREKTEVPASVWRSPDRSSRRMGATSMPKAGPASAASSPSTCRSPPRPGRERPVKSSTITVEVSAPERYAYLDLTEDLERAIKDAGVTDGAAIAFCEHTTCALLINEWEDGAMADFRRTVRALVPDEGVDYEHDDFDLRTQNLHANERKNGHAHVKAMLLSASSHAIPVIAGEPAFGRWQRLILFEMDEPKPRRVAFHVFGE